MQHRQKLLPANTLTDLFEQEGGGGEGKGPSVVVVEELLGLPGPVHHLVIDAGDVEDQAHHQAQACTRPPQQQGGGHRKEDTGTTTSISIKRLNGRQSSSGQNDQGERTQLEMDSRQKRTEDLKATFWTRFMLYNVDFLFEK